MARKDAGAKDMAEASQQVPFAVERLQRTAPRGSLRLEADSTLHRESTTVFRASAMQQAEQKLGAEQTATLGSDDGQDPSLQELMNTYLDGNGTLRMELAAEYYQKYLLATLKEQVFRYSLADLETDLQIRLTKAAEYFATKEGPACGFVALTPQGKIAWPTFDSIMNNAQFTKMVNEDSSAMYSEFKFRALLCTSSWNQIQDLHNTTKTLSQTCQDMVVVSNGMVGYIRQLESSLRRANNEIRHHNRISHDQLFEDAQANWAAEFQNLKSDNEALKDEIVRLARFVNVGKGKAREDAPPANREETPGSEGETSAAGSGGTTDEGTTTTTNTGTTTTSATKSASDKRSAKADSPPIFTDDPPTDNKPRPGSVGPLALAVS
ncbi:hypothetical protein F4803DRAFT_338299 [Xylaria telfairii]|nr:hypothetical protein F4803DRAFT_338299 [Xylaria telfairii]